MMTIKITDETFRELSHAMIARIAHLEACKRESPTPDYWDDKLKAAEMADVSFRRARQAYLWGERSVH